LQSEKEKWFATWVNRLTVAFINLPVIVIN